MKRVLVAGAPKVEISTKVAEIKFSREREAIENTQTR